MTARKHVIGQNGGIAALCQPRRSSRVGNGPAPCSMKIRGIFGNTQNATIMPEPISRTDSRRFPIYLILLFERCPQQASLGSTKHPKMSSYRRRTLPDMTSRRHIISQLAFGIVGLSSPAAAEAACRFFRRRDRSRRLLRGPTTASSTQQTVEPPNETGLYGYVRRDGSIIEPQFVYATPFSDGVAVVGRRGDDRCSIIDENGTIVVRPQGLRVFGFSEGLAPAVAVDHSDRMGFIDRRGRFVIPPQFEMANDFHDGMAEVKVFDDPKDEFRSKSGFIDTSGRQVIPFQYDFARDFSEGFAEVRFNGRWNFVDKSGRLLLTAWVDEMAYGFSEGLAAVRKNGLWGYIDTRGTFVILPRFSYISPFDSGRAVVSERDDPFRIIDTTGRFVTDRTYPWITWYSEGLAFVRGENSEQMRCIDIHGETVVSPDKLVGLSWGGDFEQGFALVSSGTNGYKYGFINRSGDVVIKPQFVQAEDFSLNLARIATRNNMISNEIDVTPVNRTSRFT